MTTHITSPPLGGSYPSLAPALIGASLKAEIEQAARLSLAMTLYLFNAAARVDLPLVKETGPTPVASRALHANVQAAVRHAALGHESPTFRDCSRPMCQDTANLVAHPMATEPGATEAELDAIFQRALAALAVDAPEAVEAQQGLNLTPPGVQERASPLFEQFWDDLIQLRPY